MISLEIQRNDWALFTICDFISLRSEKPEFSLSRQDDDLSIPSDLLIGKLSDELTLKAFNLQVHFKIYKEITAQG